LRQFEECYNLTELAEMVQEVGAEIGLKAEIYHYDNPRKEMEEHYYNPDRNNLIDLGYQPSHDVKAEIRIMLQDLLQHKDRIMERRDILVPDIRWDGTRRRSEVISDLAEEKP
jgi:UDP-sulfoquinovose synthase